MIALQSIVALTVLGLGCIGYGNLALTAVKPDSHDQNVVLHLCLSFVIGFGLLGWILYFPGIAGVFGPALFWGVGAVGTVSLIYRRSQFRGLFTTNLSLSHPEKALLALLCLVLAFDLLEGVSPPADADTLAYHFALPRDFVANGQIEFVPRAVTGAIPMLVHMTYSAALGTGGELGLTLWTMATGWAAGFLLYALVRPFVPRSWAIALLIGFLTTPAVLYGGGSGQVEIRCAAFALAGVALAVDARRRASFGLFALAGVCAGFFIGAKFFGLAFAGAVGLYALLSPQGLKRAFVFGAAAVLIGFQWYLWNWTHTGDPVFPILTNLLNVPDSGFWTREYGEYFSAMMAHGELPLERSVVNWLLYPVYATFNLVEKLESGRTGLGILTAVLFPVAVFGLARRDMWRAEFTAPLLIALVFFTVWFYSGTAQRVRHLLPIYPLVLVALFPLAFEFARRAGCLRPMALGIAATIALQLAGQVLFGYNYLRHVFSSETRSQFLIRNVPGATSAQWIDRNLPNSAKTAFMNRQLAYLIKGAAFSMHPHIQAVIDARGTVGDERRFITQARNNGITHLLLPEQRYLPNRSSTENYPFQSMIVRLQASGCLVLEAEIETVGISSRTLRQLGAKTGKGRDAVFRIVPEKCSHDSVPRPDVRLNTLKGGK